MRTRTSTKERRRTQSERTAETKATLVAAAISVIYRVGYGGATTALIAEEAGMSRGAILHHFATRAELMAHVIREVFEQERLEYERLDSEAQLGHRVRDWPAMLWNVFRQPSGVAVLEILQAARNDKDLADGVASAQRTIEDLALTGMNADFGTPVAPATLYRMRLLVWAVRGLSIAQELLPDQEVERSIELFEDVLEAAEEAGVFDEASAQRRDSRRRGAGDSS